jgi:hypothetical protein
MVCYNGGMAENRYPSPNREWRVWLSDACRDEAAELSYQAGPVLDRNLTYAQIIVAALKVAKRYTDEFIAELKVMQ